MAKDSRRLRAVLALLLLVPVPTLGICTAMVWLKGQPIGQAIFFFAKLWIIALPGLWWLLIERGSMSWSRPRRGGFGVAAGLGVAIAVIIFAAYWLIGRGWIDRPQMQAKAVEAGLSSVGRYAVMCAYWVIVNSLLEEYVWRWFVVSRCEAVMPKRAAMWASALFFTLHHIFALGLYFEWHWGVTGLGSLGVFIGGAVWSWCYQKYESIWPGYVSHAIADVPVFAIGYLLIFHG